MQLRRERPFTNGETCPVRLVCQKTNGVCGLPQIVDKRRSRERNKMRRLRTPGSGLRVSPPTLPLKNMEGWATLVMAEQRFDGSRELLGQSRMRIRPECLYRFACTGCLIASHPSAQSAEEWGTPICVRSSLRNTPYRGLIQICLTGEMG
jgi:hypothetical protein